MNMTVTGRHIGVSDRLREYAEKKMQKLEKHFDQLVDARVTMYVEKLDHGVEVLINGDGVQFHGKEKASTLYAAIDLLVEKVEKQIVKYKEKHSQHKGPVRGENPFFETTGPEGMALRLSQVSNKPVDKIEAYLQMKLNNSDFILFKKGVGKIDSDVDFDNRNYAVIYRNNGSLKMAEVPFEKIRENKFEQDDFVEYDLVVVDDSPSNPKIEFRKNAACSVLRMSLDEAIRMLDGSKDPFLPFFNVETQFFNILYRKSGEYEIAVPVF
jgi:putative sigma-54 modulation protein